MKKIVVFTARPVEGADTRYRIVQYFAFLEKNNLKIIFFPLFNKKFFKWNMENSHTFLRLIIFLWCYLKRLFQIIIFVPNADTVWISRELSPLGPPFLEQLVFLFKKRVVLDIDDAIFLPDENVKSFTHRLRDFQKFEKIGENFSFIVAGNSFIANYFRKFNNNVVIIPTVIDINLYSKINRELTNEIRIGWVGSPYYFYDFEIVKEAIKNLRKKYDFKLVIVGLNRELMWDFVEIEYFRWELNKELDYFKMFNIGIMPLRETEFEQGKCGFKIIQYMGAGIPVVASPVGVNREIIVDGENGFLAKNEVEWFKKLENLINNKEIRDKFSKNGIETVKKNFSVKNYEKKYFKILTGEYE